MIFPAGYTVWVIVNQEGPTCVCVAVFAYGILCFIILFLRLYLCTELLSLFNVDNIQQTHILTIDLRFNNIYRQGITMHHSPSLIPIVYAGVRLEGLMISFTV